MRPVKLVMENFGPFRGRAELDFSRLDDIFLITGKTGAGKTTIFDAVCFALYGQVPGSRGDHLARLCSDHAPPGGECLVSLEFTLGEKRFIAERSPRQERKKKRGGGTVVIEETLVVHEIKNGGIIQTISKKSEGDARLRELIGLEAEEFFKIVLLPQGEFAEFLKEKTSERLKVLGKLFPIEKAVRVKELAKKKTNDIEARVREADHIFNDLTRKVNPALYETARAEAAANLKAASDKSLDLEKEEALLDKVLDLRSKENDTVQRLEQSRKQREEAAASESSVNEKGMILSRSRSARPLEQFLAGLENAEAATTASQAELAAALEEKDIAHNEARESEKAIPETAAAEQEARDLREKRPALAEMLEEEQKLQSDAAELKQQEISSAELSGEIDLLKGELEKLQAAINTTEALAEERINLEKDYELSKSIHGLFLEFRKYRERMDIIENDSINAKAQIKDFESRAGELEGRIPVLEAELKKLKEDKSRHEQADMAAHLSAFLEPGKPCPVCGSTEHPSPAAGIETPFNFDERINAQEACLSEANNARTAALAGLDAKNREAAKIIENAKQLDREIRESRRNALPAFPKDYPYIDCDALLPSAETIDRVITTENKTLNDISESLKKSRDAADNIQERYREKAGAAEKLGEAEKNLATAQERIKNLTLKIAEGQQKRRVLFDSVLPGEESAARAITILDARIAEKDGFVSQRRDEREKAMLRLSGAQAACNAAAKNHDAAVKRREDAHAALRTALSQTEFNGPDEAKAALLDPADEKIIEAEIRLWRENRAGLETKIAEQEQQLNIVRGDLSDCMKENVPVPETEQEAARRLETVRTERAAAAEIEKNAVITLTTLDKDMEAQEEAGKRLTALTGELQRYKTLSDDLSGKNPKKLPFDSWLLANYLEEAASYATLRLEKMSESRYSLLLDTERQQGRGYAGLDLMVFDAHTGKTRPCATLSGGESFMASISLALGLADSIQNRSGGVKLDAVFIDEGFGTLDDTSLDKALVILDELRVHRMAGLISHVGELRSRIPCHVEVIKGGAGSRIKTD